LNTKGAPCADENSNVPGPADPQLCLTAVPLPWAYDFWKETSSRSTGMPESPSGARLQGLCGQKLFRRRANLAEPRSSLLHAVGYRGRRELHGPIHAPVQADRGLHDAGSFSNMETNPHCGLLRLLLETIGIGLMRHSRPSWKLPGGWPQVHGYLGRSGRPLRPMRTSPWFHGRSSVPHRGAAAVASFAMLMNFRGFNKDQGHGPDHHLVDPARVASTAEA